MHKAFHWYTSAWYARLIEALSHCTSTAKTMEKWINTVPLQGTTALLARLLQRPAAALFKVDLEPVNTAKCASH